MSKPLYGSLAVSYRDGSEDVYVVYMAHLVNYELRYGSMADSGVAGTARLAHLASESDEPFDDWLNRVAYVTPGETGDAAAGEAAEEVPTA